MVSTNYMMTNYLPIHNYHYMITKYFYSPIQIFIYGIYALDTYTTPYYIFYQDMTKFEGYLYSTRRNLRTLYDK